MRYDKIPQTGILVALSLAQSCNQREMPDDVFLGGSNTPASDLKRSAASVKIFSD